MALLMASLRGVAKTGPGTLQVRTERRMYSRSAQLVVRAHKVEIEHEGTKHEFEVPDGMTILETALDNGLELPHDCKMGVCMTCPARLIEGEVDQSASVVSEDVAEKGFALLCVAEPQTDCKIRTISEEEYMDEQLVTSRQ